jgi:hypothetical protein
MPVLFHLLSWQVAVAAVMRWERFVNLRGLTFNLMVSAGSKPK